jgi:hypothetical protein
MCPCRRELYPSIYTGSRAVLQAILGEDRAAPPLHGGMPPPVEGEAEQRQQGVRRPPRVGRPLTVSDDYRLWSVGFGLDLDHSLAVLCPGGVELMGVFVILLRKLASERAFW